MIVEKERTNRRGSGKRENRMCIFSENFKMRGAPFYLQSARFFVLQLDEIKAFCRFKRGIKI